MSCVVLAGAAAARAATSIVWVENHNAMYCHPDCGFELWRMAPDGAGARSTARSATRNALWADWTRDGRRLVYVYKYSAGGNEASQVRVANADLSGDREIAAELPGVRVTPQWSPDGRWVVFGVYERDRTSGEADLFTVAADGSDVRRLTALRGEELGPSFSPDGQRVIFTHREGYGLVFPPPSQLERPSVWSVAVDGGQLRRHTLGDELVGLPDLLHSPDGGRVAFGGNDRIHVLPADGGHMRAIGAQVGGPLSWSPDGRFLTYVRFGQQRSDQALWRVRVDEGAGNAMELRAGFQIEYGTDGADWISDSPWPSAAADDRRAPDVILARLELRDGRVARTTFGPSTGSPGRRRSIVVDRPNELGFVAIDSTGIRRLGALVRRRRRASGSAAARVTIRSGADWKRLRALLRRGTYELRFRSLDVLGNETTSGKLVVRIRGSRS